MKIVIRGASHTVQEFDRLEFITRRFVYRPGEHLAAFGSTQSGKTSLLFDLMQYHVKPDQPSLTLVMKPEDPTVTKYQKILGHKQISSWPPPLRWPWQPRPPGWIIQPKLSFDPELDKIRQQEVFRRSLNAVYDPRKWKRGKRRIGRIVFADEVYGLVHELKLKEDLIAIWSRGSGMGAGAWTATQVPQWCPTQMYNSYEHGFFFNEPDERNRNRIAEVSGFNSNLTKAIIAELPPYTPLYLRRGGRAMCLVRP